MCHKEGCWSTKHTQEERDKSRKRFESQINQYIADYKGDQNQEIKEAIKALVINFDSQDLSHDNQDTLESFLTTFRPVMDA